jgi:flagellar biosynthetic protein FlhB
VADDVERTEKPTPKRRAEARREGQIAISQEVYIVANLLAVTTVLLFLGETAVQQGILLFRRAWEPLNTFGPGIASERLLQAFGAAGGVVLPVLGAAAMAAVIAGIAQTGGNLATKRLRPKFSRLNPTQNVSRLIKHDAPMQLGKSIVKLLTVGGVVAAVVISRVDEYTGLSRLPLYEVIGFQLGTILRAFLAGSLVLLVLAALDYAAERYRNEKKLRMTHQEVKDERKQAEGDPQVKARQRSLQMERARTRMMAQVPEADVVVTNPDHVSIAIQYRRAEMQAPKVLAKGRGFLALRIRELAQGAGVPLVRNPPLARALYRSVKVNQSIPEKLYQAVAELLAYVYRLDRERARAW